MKFDSSLTDSSFFLPENEIVLEQLNWLLILQVRYTLGGRDKDIDTMTRVKIPIEYLHGVVVEIDRRLSSGIAFIVHILETITNKKRGSWKTRTGHFIEN